MNTSNIAAAYPSHCATVLLNIVRRYLVQLLSDSADVVVAFCVLADAVQVGEGSIAALSTGGSVSKFGFPLQVCIDFFLSHSGHKRLLVAALTDV